MARNVKTTNQVSALLRVIGAPPTRVTASMVKVTPVHRAGRALAGLGMCWGLALLTVVIPVAHFVLVPAFLIAGIVLGVRRLREGQILNVHGACPRCGFEQDFRKHVGSENRWQLECASCGHQLFLVVDQSPETSEAA